MLGLAAGLWITAGLAGPSAQSGLADNAFEAVHDGSRTARAASSFTDSVAVGVHWGYPDTPYGYAYDDVRELLVDSGIKHVRGEAFRAADLARHGIRSTVHLDAPSRGSLTAYDYVRSLAPLAESGAVVAVEGANEPDLFWVREGRTYQGQPFPKGPEAWQADLYDAVKSNPKTSHLTVIGPSLGKTYWSGGHPYAPRTFEDTVDWGNFHPYPGGSPFNNPLPYAGLDRYYWQSDFPSVALDKHPINLRTYAPAFGRKPMAITETGYSTWNFGQSERTQGIYMPRLFLENYRLGIERTYAYELVDTFSDPTGANREAHFGLLRHDLTPKPAYTAMRSLMSVLNDTATAPHAPEDLDYLLQVAPPPGYDADYLHHVLLQKPDGAFVIAMWHEVTANDIRPTEQNPRKPMREVDHPPMAVKLTVRHPDAGLSVEHLDDSGQLVRTDALISGRTAQVPVTGNVTLITIDPPHSGRGPCP